MKIVKLIFLLWLSVTTAVLAQEGETDTETEPVWYPLEEAQQLAKETGKKVLIFGMAEWCPYCRRMRTEVYPNKGVQDTLLKYFYPVIVDNESSEKVVFNGEEVTEQELAYALRLRSLPTHYFINAEGKVLGAQPGFLPADVFQKLLSFVGSDSYSTMKFDEYEYSETKQ